jgi:RimJ/RimL family protein N-acetyltransferase
MMATFFDQWALRGYGVWACKKIDRGAFIGAVGIFHPLEWPEPEIIYSLDRPFWRQGFATEAARAADWLFVHFPLARAASFISAGQFRIKTRRGAARSGLRAHLRVGWFPL